MAKKKQSKNGEMTSADYRHARDKRPNIPPAAIAAEGTVPKVPKVRYHYSPHLSPQLRFDPSGRADKLPPMVADAARRPLTEAEQRQLAEALAIHQPWLEWAGKREQHDRGYLDVEPVALHIHERVSAQAIIRAATREELQRGLFEDPQLPYQKEIQF